MSSRDKILLSVFGVIAALGATWFLLVTPKRDDARNLDTQIAAARADLAGTAARATEYRVARDRLRKHPEVFEQSARALPNRVAMPDLLRTLTRTAKGTGVKVGDLTTSAGTASSTPGISSVSLSLSFSGDFLALQRYLQRLQRFVAVHSRDVDAKGRLVALNTVQLSGGADGQLKAQVSATVYVMQPGALSLTPATTTPPASAAGAAPSSPAPAGAAASASTPPAGGVQ